MFDLLLHLGEKSEMYNNYTSSTVMIAKELKMSQQSVSRKLINLEETGLVKRQASTSGIKISLTDAGRDKIVSHYEFLSKIVENNKINAFSGRLVSGIGEGRYYVRKYIDKFRELLGYEPYIGTLNLVVEENIIKRFINQLNSIKITGFLDKERSFGNVTCYKVNIIKGDKEITGTLILPERTKHAENMVEILAPCSLRKIMALKDNDILRISKVKE